MNLCIFSGTFNPVHKAHVKMAYEILNVLSLDKMIIIPNNIPPHKSNENIASTTDRLKMLELAFDDERFYISDIEIKLGGKSYSINTVKEIKNLYKVAGKINFIVGEDSFLTIKNWYKYEEFISLVNFIIVPRDSNSDIDKIAKELNIKELSYQAINLPFMDISSSSIRNQAKRGQDLKELIPEKVASYIEEHHLFENFSFDEIKILLEQVFNVDMPHSIGVSDKAVELAKRFGVNENKAKIAGILHDCVKYIGVESIQTIMNENNIEVLPQEKDAPRTLHAPVGAFIAKDYFKINDQEILDAIRYHTVARVDMTDLEKVIFIADKIEPITREKDFRDRIEAKLDISLDAAMLEYLNTLVQKLEREQKEITPYTKDVIGYFKK